MDCTVANLRLWANFRKVYSVPRTVHRKACSVHCSAHKRRSSTEAAEVKLGAKPSKNVGNHSVTAFVLSSSGVSPTASDAAMFSTGIYTPHQC